MAIIAALVAAALRLEWERYMKRRRYEGRHYFPERPIYRAPWLVRRLQLERDDTRVLAAVHQWVMS